MSPSVPGRTTQTQPHPSPNYVKGMEASSMISESKAMRHLVGVLFLSLCLTGLVSAEDTSQPIWTSEKPQAVLIPPQLNGPMASVVESTINGYLQEAFGWMLPVHREADGPGLFIVVGDESNNSVLGSLRGHGLKLDRTDLGPEGFRILTHEAGERRFIIVTANTPVGLKHGCQELVFFRLAATHERCAVDWPLDVRMKPAFAYRGVYMLPCWSAYDSLDSWKRVLRFHSELTLNRNWFWLAGFNLLESYGGEYQKTDLANADNVRSLVELCRAEGMKFYIGGGWFTWHHQQHAAGSMERGIQYYLDMLDRLPGVEGIYLEPAGEGRDTDEKTWRERTQAFQRMARTIWERRPEFEFAIAIGEFNSKAYRQAALLVVVLGRPDPRQGTERAPFNPPLAHHRSDERLPRLDQAAGAGRSGVDRLRHELRPRPGLRQSLEWMGSNGREPTAQFRPQDGAVFLTPVSFPRALLERQPHGRGIRLPSISQALRRGHAARRHSQVPYSRRPLPEAAEGRCEGD